MSSMHWFSSVVFAFLLATVAHAERPPQDKKTATDVVTGTVVKVTIKDSLFGGDGVKTDYTAEVKVDKVERGDTKPGDTIKVTWFHVTKRPSRPLAGAFGHAYSVKEKEMIRVYTIKGKGDDFGVIYNREGIEKVKE